MKKLWKTGEAAGKRKVIRSLAEAVILLFVVFLIIRALCSFTRYQPYDPKKVPMGKDGFIALSYFGVDREGDEKLIAQKQLKEHLTALKERGYVTVGTKDILDYYTKGKELPEKALYLMFEDGRTDTAIFAQKILEELNDCGVMMSYASRCKEPSGKFLQISDLKELQKSSYWEFGTNGYRLSYINVCDRQNTYLGAMDAETFNAISDRLDRDYNHYLMDYIRDEDHLPTESRKEMEERIAADYQGMKKVYEDGLSAVPAVYALMHANTGSFGNNERASRVNENWIKSMFSLNFNREGFCMNRETDSPYDLTRMQPQSYWPVNHLLMRIGDDTGQKQMFERGEEKMLSGWKLLNGAVQYKDQKIILTTPAKGTGSMFYEPKTDTADYTVHTKLLGNRCGEQTLCLRTDRNLDKGVILRVKDGRVKVCEKKQKTERVLSEIQIEEPDGILEKQTEKTGQKTDAAEAQAKNTDIRDAGNTELTVQLTGQTMMLTINGKQKEIVSGITQTKENGIALLASWSNGYSQRNLADDVYDGIFSGFSVTDENRLVLCEGRYRGAKAAVYRIGKLGDSLVNRFLNLFEKSREDRERKNITAKENGQEKLRSSHYPVDQAEKLAKKRYQTDRTEAECQRAESAEQQKVALVFDGLTDAESMEKIAELLKEYQAEAVFFTDGMSAAEDSETIKSLSEQGFTIGNYGMNAEKHLEQKTPEDCLSSLASASAVIGKITGKTPKLFHGNVTKLTPQVLQCVHAAGMQKAVEPSVYLSSSSFPDFAAAMGFIRSLSPGDIICVKLKEPLDETEYEPFVQDAKPAEDKQADETDTKGQEDTESEETVPIEQTVRYLLEALRTAQIAVADTERLQILQDESIRDLFAEEQFDSYAVPQSEPVTEDYFSDALFLGDSLTQALAGYRYPDGVKELASVCAYKGITPQMILSDVKMENVDGAIVQVQDEIREKNPSKIYLQMGENAMAGMQDQKLVESYASLVDWLQEIFPQTPVFIQTMPPVTKTVATENVLMTNARIRKVNGMLAKLSQEKHCYFLDLYHALCDEEGNLPYGIAREDGIHLKEAGTKRWIRYLTEHVPQ